MVFQTSVLDEMLTVRENLAIRARQYKGLKPNRVSSLIDRLGLSAFQKQKYGTLSGGQKRRVDIARALLSQPDILFLDEPTTGLDIQTRKSIWDLLYQLQREEGMTVVLTTHYLDEADEADQIYIVDHGKLIAQGSALDIKSQYAKNILKIRFKEIEQIESLKTSGMSVEQQSQLEYVFQPESEREAIDYLAQVRDRIAHFEFRPGTMDDAFIALTGRRFANASLTKAKFFIVLQESSRSFLLLVGSLDFLYSLYYFLQKNLTDAWAQLPNSGPLLNNWLMSGTLAVTGITTSLAALTQLVKDREHQVDKDLYLSNQGKWRLPFSYLAKCNHHFFAMQVLMYVLMCSYFREVPKLYILTRTSPNYDA